MLTEPARGHGRRAPDLGSDSQQSGNWQAYNDATWPWSPWRLPDGRLAVINHQEYHCLSHGTCTSDRWYPSLTVSIANDGVHIGTPAFGVMARSSYPFAGDQTQVFGAYSDPSSIVQNPFDGLFYMISMFKSGGGQGPTVGNCVLRTPNILDPNAWRVGSYCAIWSMDQLRGCGWPYDFWALPEFANHGGNTLQGAFSGRCTCGVPPVPFGCYRIGGGGFFSNGQGRSCPFLGSQMQNICGTTNFWALPERTDHGLNVVDGQCSG